MHIPGATVPVCVIDRGWEPGDLTELLRSISSTYGPATVVCGRKTGKVEVWFQTFCESGKCAPQAEIVALSRTGAHWEIVRRKSYVY